MYNYCEIGKTQCCRVGSFDTRVEPVQYTITNRMNKVYWKHPQEMIFVNPVNRSIVVLFMKTSVSLNLYM